MGREWKEVVLEELATFQRGFDLPLQKRITGNIPVIASTGITGWHSDYKVKAPGVVIGRSGSIGGGQYIAENFWPLNTTLWVKDFHGNDERYCYYHILSLDLSRFNAGSGVPTLNRNHIHTLPINLPPLPEQKAIAHILGSLDDKIELNHKMNQTLEAMAQALFKSWFVDFDPVIDNALAAGNEIPDELAERAEKRKACLAGRQALGDLPAGAPAQASKRKPLPPACQDALGAGREDIQKLFPDEFVFSDELDRWIPAGWECKSLDEVGNIITGKTPPKKIEGAYGSGVMFLTPTDFDGSLITNSTLRRLSHTGQDSIKNCLLESDTICVTCIGSQMGQATLVREECCTNQQLNSITPYDSDMTYYLLFNLRNRRNEIYSIGSSGSTMPIINKTSFSLLSIMMPEVSVLKYFNKITSPYIHKYESVGYNNNSLECLRDTLLPKLLSGEIRIEDAEEFVGTLGTPQSREA
jgi:type I restriction enzyme S subunit